VIRPSRNPIVLVATRTLAPAIQVMAVYVILHGHYSPGGGFQGGVLLAASFVLTRLSYGDRAGRRQLPTERATLLSAAGALGFIAVGLVALAGGGRFLDYGFLPLPGFTPPMLHFYGILIVEVAVGVAVAGALVSIFDDLMVGGGDG
jgi:multicomponent Na+:H+ antiporter subunit B